MAQLHVLPVLGLDVSVGSMMSLTTVTLTSTVLLGVSSATGGDATLALIIAIAAAVAVGLVNELFVAVLRMKALIVTLAVGALVGGLTLGYRQTLRAEATVPSSIAEFGGARFLGVANPFWIALLITLVATIVLRKTIVGRNFEAVGANLAAARAIRERTDLMVLTVDTLVCVEPGQLRLEQRPAPDRRADQVLVRPLRVGICGTDYHIFAGSHPFLQYPRVMGHELAVEVLEVADCSGLTPGEVYAINPYLSCGQCNACSSKPNCCVRLSVLGVHQDGGMTGLLTVPAASLLPAPGLTPDQCAAVEFLAIGAHAVRRGAVTGSERALVVGAGPIGLGVALFARLSGAEVVLFDRDAARAEVVASIAAVTPLPEGNDPSETAEGFDVVFDATGAAPSMERGFDFVAYGGRYVLVSVVNEPITFQDPDFHRKEMTVLGSRNATRADFDRVLAAIRAGEVAIERLITHRTRLADAVEDIPHWATNKSGLIKAVVELD